MSCYITQTGSFLPGPPVANHEIETYLGKLRDESQVKQLVLRMNGILGRHYAQTPLQQATHDVYDLAQLAASDCLLKCGELPGLSFLAAGTTYAPFTGPGIASRLHDQLSRAKLVNHAIEISSHAGICTSAAAALVGAIRAVSSGEHSIALSVGSEHASEILKSSAIELIEDRHEFSDVRKSQWFMSIFLRFMLSDGSGAFLLESRPRANQLSLRVDWTHSRSYAHRLPVCMQLETRSARLTQDVAILARHLAPAGREFLAESLLAHQETLDHYDVILPHLSSFYFRRKFEQILQENTTPTGRPVEYWTNLGSVGNTGAASIYIMLDHYLKTHEVSPGTRFLLFIPESGQFNFVMLSLTAVAS